MATPGSTTPHNPWFSVSIGLMGLIFGYSLASFTGGNFGFMKGGLVNNPPAAPSVPSVPAAAAQPAADTPVPDVTSADHLRGDPNAKVTIVEYTDHECPFCEKNFRTRKEVEKAYGNDVAFVIRHFPLDFHANAQKEAEATECAAQVGGESMFWKYSDSIFEQTTSNGTGFALDKLVPLAKDLGIDEAKFKECLDSGSMAEKVKAEQQAGATAGINGTPGIVVINNATKAQTRLPGAVPLSDYQAAIDPILGKVQ